MNMCRYHGIDLWQIERTEIVEFSLYAKDYKKIRPIAKKTGVLPRIRQKTGFPFLWWWLIHNWTFSSGFLFFLVLLAILSSYVWEITFQGQRTYTKETLIKTVNEMGVHRGMRRSHLFCDDIEKNVRECYPDISWVSAEEKGSRLVISIKEAEKLVPRQSDEMPCHLVAKENGEIRSITVNKGIAAVKKGQKVKKGQILISGIIPITDDSDQVVSNTPVAAKGSVEIYVDKSITETIPIYKKVKDYTGKEFNLYEFSIKDKSISIKNPFKRFNNSCKYDIIGTKKWDYNIQPFAIPITRYDYSYREYRWKTIRMDKKQLTEDGKKRFDKIKREIRNENHKILCHSAQMKKKNASMWQLVGHIGYLCSDTQKQYIKDSEWQVERKAEDKKIE